MKTINLIFLLVAFTVVSYAQLLIPAGTIAPPSFPNCTPTLLQQGGDVEKNLFGTDKDFPTFTRKVQMFEFEDTDDFNIVGVVFWIGYLQVNGAPGNLSFGVYDFCGWTGMTLGSKLAGFTVPNQTSPGELLDDYAYRATKSTSEIIASNCLDDANVIVFDKPINIKSGVSCYNKYGIGVEMYDIGDDVLGIYSTNLNEGALNSNSTYKELAWEFDNSYTATGAWFTILASTDASVNADMLIFPILDMSAYNAGASTGVCAGSSGQTKVEEHSNSFNGMKLSQSYPNPTKEYALIEYTIEVDADVTLSIYDLAGKRIKKIDESYKRLGRHDIQIDVRDLKSGSYIYVLNANGKVLAKQMMLTK